MRLHKINNLFGILFATFFIGCGGGSSGGGGNNNPTPLAITTPATLQTAVVKSPYSLTLAASGGTAPYIWSVTAGTLPAGLALSTAGVLSGTPTAAGSGSFTVQAKDSASSPQTAMLSATLAVNPALAITTTSPLANGTLGQSYNATLAATGGISPYTWTVPSGTSLPAGLTLSSSGVLSGTPTTPYANSFTVQVADSESTAKTATASLTLLITPGSGTIPDGHYTFGFAGTGPQGTPAAQNAVALAGTFTVQSGKVLAGEYDENTNANVTPAASAVPVAITGGALTNGSDGLGTLVLTTAAGNLTFSLATPPSAAAGGSAPIHIIEYDDTTGTGMRGSGVLKIAQASPTIPPAGSYVFLVRGTDPTQRQQVLGGFFQTDANGNIGNGSSNVGVADSNEGGTIKQFPNVQSRTPITVDANGRGLMGFVLGVGGIGVPGNTVFHYAFYQVSPEEWYLLTVDPPTSNAPLASGTVLAQTGSGAFTAASIPATSVLEISGLTPSATRGVTTPDITIGINNSDQNGTISFHFDEYNGTLSTGQNLNLAYMVDPATGRVATTTISNTPTAGPTLYLIDNTRALVLGYDASSSSGLLEAQTRTGLESSGYLGGNLPLSNTGVLNEGGIISEGLDSTITFTTNRSTPQGLVLYRNVTGTYTTDPTGRIVITTPDGLTRILYVVSPTKLAYLTSDGGGYLGSFEQ